MASTRQTGSSGFWHSLFSNADKVGGALSQWTTALGGTVSGLSDSIGKGVSDNTLAKQGLYNKTEENKTKYRSLAVAGSVVAVAVTVIIIVILEQ